MPIFEQILRRTRTTRQPRPNESLERELFGWQIFMILISGILGGLVIFGGDGIYLRTAAPAGLMTAILYVGFNAIFVMEGLSELIVLWPVSNAMVEFVRTFVDEDLGLVVGLTYWYSWSSFIATMFVVAANSATYWNIPGFWQTSAYYVLGPLVVLSINAMGVKWFGWVEGLLGIAKLFFFIAGALYLLVIGGPSGTDFINAGYGADKAVASNAANAVLLIIPSITYGFLGVEIVTVAAFEARNPRSPASAKWIAYVITLLFILCGIGQARDIFWTDDNLPRWQSSGLRHRDAASSVANESLLVLIARLRGHHLAAGVWNGFLILSSLSTANTCLYVASRTLYGLCRNLPQYEMSWIRRWPAKLGTLDPRTRVPFWALIASTAFFFWLPFLHLQRGTSAQNLLDVMITIGSVGILLVWASQCLAFIRYFNWMRLHKDILRQLNDDDHQTYGRYDRDNPDKSERFHSLLSPIQPAPAYIGLTMCLLTIFVFSSAVWWKNNATFKEVAVAYTGPIACTILFIALKAYRYHRTGLQAWNPRTWGTDLSLDPRRFQEIIGQFEDALYLRGNSHDDESVPETAEVAADHGGRSATTMNGAVRQPNLLHAEYPLPVESVVGAGVGLGEAAMRTPPSSIRPSDT